MKRKIFFLSIVVAAAALTFYWVRGDNPEAVRAGGNKDTENLKELEQKLTSFSIDGRTSKGVKQWHLEGTSAEMIEEKVHFNDLKAVAYSEEGSVNLTSDTGIYNKNKGEVTLIGSVRVVSGEGAVLTTEKATWSQNTKEICSDALIRIERENMIATGEGGEANSAQKKATLKKDVRVEIKPDTKVRSDGPLVVDHDKNVAVFNDNVMVEDKDGRMFADKLTVHFNPDTHKIAEVVAEGNVKVKRGKSYTISEKAVYTESTKSAKLSGRPRIIIDPEELADLDGMSVGR
ncbi:MAG: LPS export ABC transporter periplasmic protein LptC [Candidatus Omnitrophota bacterium]